MRPKFRILASVMALVAALAATGCATIPQYSEVKYGSNVKAGLNSDYLYYSPTEPTDGMTREEILRGFLNAATGPQNDYAVARQYLSSGLRSDWLPTQEVLIQEGQAKSNFLFQNIATVEVGVQATVDALGHYQALPKGSTRVLDYAFVKQDGQWRISAAPNVTLLLRPVFDVIFRNYSVYFWNSNRSQLVPDLRWFPARASTATRLVTAVLEGPSDWLVNTSSAAPKGTELALDSVTEVDGVAQVNLTPEFLTAGPNQRQYFREQLRATLSQLGQVNDVRILVQNSPQDIPALAVPKPAEDSANPFVMSEFALSQPDSPSQVNIGKAKRYLQLLQASDFALNAGANLLAIKHAGGVSLVSLQAVTDDARIVDPRAELLSPQFDQNNQLWTATANGDAGFAITSSDSTSYFAPNWLKDLKVRDFALSPEGDRLAVLAGSDGKFLTYVLAVKRSAGGIVTGLGNPIQLPSHSGSPVSLSWGNATQVLVLYREFGSANTIPVSYLVGGDSRELGRVPDGARIIGSNTGSVLVLTTDGVLLEYRGYSWTTLTSQVQAAKFAG